MEQNEENYIISSLVVKMGKSVETLKNNFTFFLVLDSIKQRFNESVIERMKMIEGNLPLMMCHLVKNSNFSLFEYCIL